MARFLILLLILAGCSTKIQTTKYAVVSSFNEVMIETDDREKAYEVAHNLTLMGRVFASKPFYFVIEKK